MRRNNLVELREKRNLTRGQLAARLGISEVFVKKMEYGVANPSRKTSLKFESFYRISERVLFPDLFHGKYFTKNE